MEAALLIDIGSTYTKACSIDLEGEAIIATACTLSTVNTSVVEGIDRVVQELNLSADGDINYKICLASSSAAGGLRIVVVGLVPELTVKAGKLSAYNAGGKIVGTYSYKLNKNEIIEIENLDPDILLFVGGTDGGNEEVLLWNASMLAESKIRSPVIFAGNKVVAVEVKETLEKNNINVFLSENVLSQIDKIRTYGLKEIIRKIFIERITVSKGIADARSYVDNDIVPTPLAVFNAVKLLSSGTDTVEGVGELIAIDIGGATTDIYSSAAGNPTLEGITLKGLTLPYDMRTVEGDLGLRISAASTLSEAKSNNAKRSDKVERIDISRIAEEFSKDITLKPDTDDEKIVDLELASYAIQIALKRHVGYIEEQYTPTGKITVQHGKDLRGIGSVLCTGGLFSNNRGDDLVEILNTSFNNETDPSCLKPMNANYFIDNDYILYGIGLLSVDYPDKALRIFKKTLTQIE